MPNFAASVTLMFNEVDLLDRFEQAASVGFRAVEVQAPYGESPEDIADRLRCHALTPVLFNLPTAVGAIPGQEAEFQQGVTRALEYAEATSCRQLHCLAGKTDDSRAEGTFVSNLQWASEQARPLGVRLLIEPLNTRDNPGYFLTRSAQARRSSIRLAPIMCHFSTTSTTCRPWKAAWQRRSKPTSTLSPFSDRRGAGSERTRPRPGDQLSLLVRSDRRPWLHRMGRVRVSPPWEHHRRARVG